MSIFCLLFSSFLLFETIVSAHELKIYNACPFTVWVGILGNSGHPALENGGFALNQWASRSVQANNGWQGRVWGRTRCDASGHCETGDCGNRIECRGAGGVPPVTLAEITFDGWGGIDYYDISLVDGYNLPMNMKPIGGTFTRHDPNSRYACTVAGCNRDLNAICPWELAVKNSGGWTVACKSACLAFNTDVYCCRGAHNTPATCKREMWPKDYPAIFKRACPKAYSYAYDDQTSTFTCKSAWPGSSGYTITLCP